MNEASEMVKTTGQDVESIRKCQVVAPHVDIYENADELLLVADLPGVERDDLSINFDKNTLTVDGLRKVVYPGSEPFELDYRRAFTVPRGIDATKINAELKHGVLSLHLPKAEEVKPRQIPINVD